MVKVTVEETNVESMDTTDADDTETITLTRNKVLLLFYVCAFVVRNLIGFR